MKIVHCLLVVVMGSWGPAAMAHPSKPTPPASSSPLPAAEAGTPTATIEAFHSSLSAGDREGAFSWLDPNVMIFESGGAEMSREEYASHHLESDMAFAGATKTEVVDRQARSAGDTAWVLSRTRTTGQFRDRPVDVDGVETMILQRDAGHWRIVHIHWSTHDRKSKKK